MRSLWPREHGAYAQLLAPLITALVLAPPTVPAVLLALGACCAFLAYEPLLVLRGHRGPRLRESAGHAARLRLALTTLLALGTGGLGLVLARPATWTAAAVVAVPAAVLVALAWRRTLHSLAGELVAVVALAGAGMPVAIASGAALERAALLWLAWTLGFGASVIAVHHVIARRRGPTPHDRARVLAIIAFTLVTLWPAVLPALPIAVTAVVVALVSPSPRHLRTIGVGLVVASLVSGTLAVVIT